MWTSPLLLVRTTLSYAAKTSIPQNLGHLTNKTLFLQHYKTLLLQVCEFSASLGQFLTGDSRTLFACVLCDPPFQKVPSRVKFHWRKESWKATQGLLINSAQKWHSLLLLTAHWPYYQTNCKEGWKTDTFCVSRKKKNETQFCEHLRLLLPNPLFLSWRKTL